MSTDEQLVVFLLEGQRYALPLSVVDRFVRAVEITALPGAPRIVLGAIDVAGVVVPVLSLRRRFGLPDRELALTDQFLLARTSARPVALVVDDAVDVAEVPPEAVSAAGQVVPGLEGVQGVARLHDGLVLIHDLERCLSLAEGRVLDEALGRVAPAHA